MAHELKCDGCGVREDARVSDKRQTIRPTKFVVSTDAREWSPGETYEADLCPTCRGTMLFAYFGHPGNGGLDVPAFAEPTEAERVRAGHHG